MRCEFCNAVGVPLYEVSIGATQTTLFRCSLCGSCQIEPLLDESIVQEYYSNGYFFRNKGQLIKSELLALDYLKKITKDFKSLGIIKGRFLEVGAGYGFFAHSLSMRYGVNVDIIELSRDCRDFIFSTFPELNIVGKTLYDLPSEARYHCIFCFHVVEHLQRLSPFLEAISIHLQKKGRLYILTPNSDSINFRILGNNWGWACPSDHYQFLSQHIPEHYFSQFGLRLLLNKDILPAAIHFPTVWRQKFLNTNSICVKKIKNAPRLKTIHWRILQRLCVWAYQHLEQNRKSLFLLSIEKNWTGLINRSPFDELFIVLEKQ